MKTVREEANVLVLTRGSLLGCADPSLPRDGGRRTLPVASLAVALYYI